MSRKTYPILSASTLESNGCSDSSAVQASLGWNFRLFFRYAGIGRTGMTSMRSPGKIAK